MTTLNDRDREVSELARNSHTRLERDLIVASYREEAVRNERARLEEFQRRMKLHAANGGDCPYEAAAVGRFADELKTLLRAP